MKPPKIIYFVCLLSWAGLLLYLGQILKHSAKLNYFILTIIAGLVVYLSYFCYQRFTYDRLPTRTKERFSDEIEVRQNEPTQIGQVHSEKPVKLNIRLSCAKYQPDEKFPLKIVDRTNRVVWEDSYIPVFGKFIRDVQVQATKNASPLTICLSSESASPRKIYFKIEFAEILK